jgi:hypothetical protein
MLICERLARATGAREVCLLSTRSSGAERHKACWITFFFPELRLRRLRRSVVGGAVIIITRPMARHAFRDVFEPCPKSLCIVQGVSWNQPGPARCDDVVDR